MGLREAGGTFDIGRCQRVARLAHMGGARRGVGSPRARQINRSDDIGLDLANTVYALDSTDD